MISYIKRPKTKNLGDILSTPDNYFHIESETPLNILGGGQWNVFEFDYDTAKNTILWSVGLSIKFNCSLTINQLPYLKWSFRDIDFVDSSYFLPCVSCLNKEILTEPTGNDTLYYINGDKNLKLNENSITNTSTYTDFINRWKSSELIITNSYHGIYWALLSGRKVIPFGYSTKFISLMKSFDLEFPIENFYNDNEDIVNLFKRFSFKKFSVNSNEYLDRFRSMNLEFADSLREFGVIANPVKMY